MVKSKDQEIKNKLKVFEYARTVGNISKACRYYGISRETYYKWYRNGIENIKVKESLV